MTEPAPPAPRGALAAVTDITAGAFLAVVSAGVIAALALAAAKTWFSARYGAARPR